MKIKIICIILGVCIFIAVGVVYFLLDWQPTEKEVDSSLEKITIEGIFIKDLGHPFGGSAILTKDGYFRISGDKVNKIMKLKDSTRLKVAGWLIEEQRFIPESGDFSKITEKIINAESFEVLK